MAFITMLAISIMVGLLGSLNQLETSYDAFKNDSGSPSVSFYMDLTKDEDVTGIELVDGVGEIEKRMRFDSYLRREDGRPLIARIFSFEDERKGIIKPYFEEKAPIQDDMMNVAVSEALAKSNGISVGQDIDLGFGDTFTKFHVYAIYAHPTAIYIRPSPFIAADNRDFGHIMIPRSELKKAEEYVIRPFIEAHPDFVPPEGTWDNEALFEALADITGNPERIDHYFTEVLVEAKMGYSEDQVANSINEFLEGKTKVLETIKESESIYDVFIRRVDAHFHTAGLFLPLFFFAVSLAIMALFTIQIVKIMTRDIGTMLSVGVSHMAVIGLLSCCTLTVIGIASAVGIGFGSIIMVGLVNIFKSAYFMPMITFGLDGLATFLAVLIAAIVSQIAVLIASHNVFRITPKDAMISNESKRKKLPRFLEKGMDKMPVPLRMASNSIAQNPRRFLVSLFAIVASTMMIIIAGLFNVSVNSTIEQTIHTRLRYDAQVYCTSAESDSTFLEGLSSESYISKAEQGYFTWSEASFGGKKTFVELVGVDVNNQSLQYIPSLGASERLQVQEEGLILPEYFANYLGCAVGDELTFGEAKIKVTAISTQYMHYVGYLSMKNVEKISSLYVSTYFVNTSDEKALMTYVSMKKLGSFVVNSSSYRADLHERHDPINAVAWTVIAFSLAMALATLTITAQDQLIEQKKSLSILRAEGYQVADISRIWLIQRAVESILSAAIASPIAFAVLRLLMRQASGEDASYPSIADYRWFLIAIAFVFAVILVAHLISMRSIGKWNIADNTRSRE